MKKILITGSSGMLGTALCGVLAEEFVTVGIDIIRPQPAAPVPDTFHEACITDKERIAAIFEKERPEIIIHAAAWTDVDGCEIDPEKAHKINTAATEHISFVSEKMGVPLIFISTDFVFDGGKGSPYKENDGTNPLSVYGKTKREAEKIIESTVKKYVILRTSWLYGKYGKNFVDTIISKAKENKSLRVVNDQTGSPTYTEDLSRAIKVFIKKTDINGGEIFHISNAGRCTWYDLASWILDKGGAKGVSVTPITSDELAAPAPRPVFSVLDTDKFERSTDYTMRPWQEALEEYLGEK